AEAAARRVGQRAGDGLGDGLTDGATAGADDAVDATESKLDRLKTAALGIGLAAGAVLVDAFGQAMEQSQITGKLGASMGKTPAEAQRYGHIAGELYANAVTEDFQGAADVIGATMAAGLVPPGATNAQIQSIATNLHDLSDTFELDLGQAANAVGQIMKTGLAPNAKAAIDVMTRGMQVMGPRADDLADTFNEYSTIFRQMGLSAGDATGIMAQGMQAGARDTDVVADSLKELVLITQGGGKQVDAAFKKIGLSGKDMQTAFSKGGPEAKKGLDKIFDGLRKVKDPADRAQLAVTLFGTKAEDMQKALFAIDPSKAVDSLGQVGGAADKMGNSIRDNAAVQVEQFKRRAMQTLVEFIGTKVIPVLMQLGGFVKEHSAEFKIAALVITGVVVPALTLMGITATVAAGKVVWGWVTSGAAAVKGAGVQVASAVRTSGAWLAMQARAVGSFVATAASATLSAARTAAAWLLTGAKMTGTFLLAVLRVAAVAIAQFALMAARAVAWAAVMAAQWLIAMGPIGWAIAAVVGLAALVIANWDTVKKYTLIAWNWVSAIVRGAVVATIGWIRGLASIPGMVSGYFGRMKDAAVQKAVALVAWVKGLPARARSALGGLGTALYNSGASLIQGFVNGILSKFSAVTSTVSNLVSKARDFFPFSPAKTGPFAGRGYTLYSGRALADAFGQGIADQAPGVRKQLASLTGDLSTMTAVRPGMSSLAAPSSTAWAPGAGVGRGQTPRIVKVGSDGSAFGDLLVSELRKKIQAVGGGDVQLVLGRG
ncbi:phage tail tape measure protein, partial [Streptomyces sp. NPDC002491]